MQSKMAMELSSVPPDKGQFQDKWQNGERHQSAELESKYQNLEIQDWLYKLLRAGPFEIFVARQAILDRQVHFP